MLEHGGPLDQQLPRGNEVVGTFDEVAAGVFQVLVPIVDRGSRGAEFVLELLRLLSRSKELPAEMNNGFLSCLVLRETVRRQLTIPEVDE